MSFFQYIPEWAGITPDESVLHGGNHGPYVQSQRLELYNREIQTLLDNGTAYRCFCTERRLDLLRKQAIKLRQKFGYDNRCRHLTADQVAQKLASNTPHCIRYAYIGNFFPFFSNGIFV